MPRRNRPARRRRRVVIFEEEPKPSPELLARDLVARGLCSRQILRPTTNATRKEPPDASPSNRRRPTPSP